MILLTSCHKEEEKIKDVDVNFCIKDEENLKKIIKYCQARFPIKNEDKCIIRENKESLSECVQLNCYNKNNFN